MEGQLLNKVVYTTTSVTGGWAGAVMSWAEAVMIWALGRGNPCNTHIFSTFKELKIAKKVNCDRPTKGKKKTNHPMGRRTDGPTNRPTR